MSSKLTIIIIHWNTPDLLRAQLETLFQTDHQIIVVDNASDEPLTWLPKEFKNIELIQNKLNKGFAAACNQGVVNAKGEWLLFLNPDVTITDENINEMLREAEKRKLHACSPQPTSENYKKPIPSTLSLLAEFTPLKKILPLKLFPQKTLTGGCLLIKNQVVKNISGWDERFFLWFEDSDLTLRLIQHKYRIGWINVPIDHIGGATFERLDGQFKRDIFFHSMEIFAFKHFSAIGKSLITKIKKRYSKRKTLPLAQTPVSITVPNMKKDLLHNFLKENKNFLPEETIVVTNALDHNEIWEIRKQYPEIRFISIEKNHGFAHTVNIGFRVSTGEWVGTINDDVTMSDKWDKLCLSCASEKAGSINPVIMTDHETIESVGITVDWKGKAFPKKTILTGDSCITVDATNGAAVFYSHEALDDVGIFDEKFGSYLEDIDLSLRLKRKGYKNRVSTQSVVLHKGHATSKHTMSARKQFYDFRNWIYVISKNWGIKRIIKHFPEIIVERGRNISGFLKSL